MNCLVRKDFLFIIYIMINGTHRSLMRSHFIDDNRYIIGDWPKYLFHASFQFWRGTIQVSRSILHHRGFLPLTRYLILSRFIYLSIYSFSPKDWIITLANINLYQVLPIIMDVLFVQLNEPHLNLNYIIIIMYNMYFSITSMKQIQQ